MNHHHHPQPNQSYYGPPIYAYPPPSSQDQFRRILAISIRLFVFFCVAFGLTILILYLIFHPQRMQLSVSSASLTQFSFNSSSPGDQVLAFNLSANLTFRNPNNRVGIYYDWLQANVDYDGVRFGWAGLPGFYQGRKAATEVAAEFVGRSAFGGGGGNVTGDVEVDLWVFGRVRYRLGWAVSRRYFMRAFCPLELSLGKGGGAYFVHCKVLNP